MADSRIRVGMPNQIWLDLFGFYVWEGFATEAPPYLVGSALTGEDKRGWRDVDVRLILPDEEWVARRYGHVDLCHTNARWVAETMAWSAFGHKLTGLPIDFQVQPLAWANQTYPFARSALGINTKLLLAGRFTSSRESDKV